MTWCCCSGSNSSFSAAGWALDASQEEGAGVRAWRRGCSCVRALSVAKFTRIKPGDLQHEADGERRFNIPGSFWGDQCNEGDEDQMYAV